MRCVTLSRQTSSVPCAWVPDLQNRNLSIFCMFCVPHGSLCRVLCTVGLTCLICLSQWSLNSYSVSLCDSKAASVFCWLFCRIRLSLIIDKNLTMEGTSKENYMITLLEMSESWLCSKELLFYSSLGIPWLSSLLCHSPFQHLVELNMVMHVS